MEQEEIKNLEDIFVTKADCSAFRCEIQHQIAKDSLKIAVIENQIKVITWLCTTITAGVIALVIKAFI